MPVGKSLVEDDLVDTARDHAAAGAGARRRSSLLPTDHVVADKLEAGIADRDARRWAIPRLAIAWASTSARRPRRGTPR